MALNDSLALLHHFRFLLSLFTSRSLFLLNLDPHQKQEYYLCVGNKDPSIQNSVAS